MRPFVQRFADAVDAAAPKDHTTLTEAEMLDVIDTQLHGGGANRDDEAFRSAMIQIGVAAMCAWDNKELGRYGQGESQEYDSGAVQQGSGVGESID